MLALSALVCLYGLVCFYHRHEKSYPGKELASLVAQTVKNLPAMQETQVTCLGLEDPWRREWLPTPVLLPGELHGRRSLTGCSPWGHKESDKTE